jgi:hypothetical protein
VCVRLHLHALLRARCGVILALMPVASAACYTQSGWTSAACRGCALRPPRASVTTRSQTPLRYVGMRACVVLRASGAVALARRPPPASYTPSIPHSHAQQWSSLTQDVLASRAVAAGAWSVRPRTACADLRASCGLAHARCSTYVSLLCTWFAATACARVRATGMSAQPRPHAARAQPWVQQVVWRQARSSRRRRDKLRRETAPLAARAECCRARRATARAAAARAGGADLPAGAVRKKTHVAD